MNLVCPSNRRVWIIEDGKPAPIMYWELINEYGMGWGMTIEGVMPAVMLSIDNPKTVIERPLHFSDLVKPIEIPFDTGAQAFSYVMSKRELLFQYNDKAPVFFATKNEALDFLKDG